MKGKTHIEKDMMEDMMDNEKQENGNKEINWSIVKQIEKIIDEKK